MGFIRDNGYTLHHLYNGPVDSNHPFAFEIGSREKGEFYITGGSAPKGEDDFGTYNRGYGKTVRCHPPFEWRKDED